MTPLKLLPFVISSSLILSGCSALGSGDDTRFYSLKPIALSSTEKSPLANTSLRVGIGPVSLTRLLRRPQIVTRKSSTEIEMAEKHQWGGILKEDLTLVMADNFSGLLGTENIEQFPWKLDFKPNYSVRIDIEQLDGQLDGEVTLKARWRLKRGREEVRVMNSVLTSKVNGKDFNAYVAAQSDVLFKLSQLIVKEMR
ncbi:membrane integrity-associated transporter subunit PqiC [Leucothrix sargassi]|nr:membrane integrity-associated transporter subunit PqiC [Leucothrix sargassi]